VNALVLPKLNVYYHELAINAMMPTLSSFRDFFQFLGLSLSSFEKSMI